MPRIKKPKHPPLPTKFKCPNASTYIPPEFGFKLGDYVKYDRFKGWVCGSDTRDDCAEGTSNPRNQIVVFLENRYNSSVNGNSTYTGNPENWRRIENPTM